MDGLFFSMKNHVNDILQWLISPQFDGLFGTVVRVSVAQLSLYLFSASQYSNLISSATYAGKS